MQDAGLPLPRVTRGPSLREDIATARARALLYNLKSLLNRPILITQMMRHAISEGVWLAGVPGGPDDSVEPDFPSTATIQLKDYLGTTTRLPTYLPQRLFPSCIAWPCRTQAIGQSKPEPIPSYRLLVCRVCRAGNSQLLRWETELSAGRGRVVQTVNNLLPFQVVVARTFSYITGT